MRLRRHAPPGRVIVCLAAVVLLSTTGLFGAEAAGKGKGGNKGHAVSASVTSPDIVQRGFEPVFDPPSCDTVVTSGADAPPIANTGVGTTTVVASQAEFDTAIASAQPGDVIEIADGTYTDFIGTVPTGVDGTVDENIVIRAQDSQKAVFTGHSLIEVESNFVTVQGLRFVNNAAIPPGDAPLAVAIVLNGHNDRVTEGYFYGNGLAASGYRHVVNVTENGTWNLVDSNVFEMNKAIPMGVRVTAGSSPVGNRFSWNTLLPVDNTDVQGGYRVGIQIGQGEASRLIDTNAKVQFNHIYRFDATESVGIKSSGNTVRYNCVEGGQSALGVRLGTNNDIENNVIVGQDVGMRTGIILADQDNTVRGNTVIVEDPPNAGVVHNGALMLDPEATQADGSNSFDVSTGNLIENNKFAAIAPSSPLFWVQTYMDNNTQLPYDNTLQNNCFVWLDDSANQQSPMRGFFLTEKADVTNAQDLVDQNTFANNSFWSINAGDGALVPSNLIGVNGNQWQDCT